jgi:tetratricopeptide (TPR) repeat protein
LPQAIDQFRAVIKLRPEYADAHQNLGVALTQLNLDTEAVEEFRKTLALDPNYFSARANLVQAYARLKQSDEAVAAAKQAVTAARSAGHPELAAQIETWLEKYQSQQPKTATPSSQR